LTDLTDPLSDIPDSNTSDTKTDPLVAYPILTRKEDLEAAVSDEDKGRPVRSVNPDVVPDLGVKIPECSLCKLLFRTPEDYAAHFAQAHKEDFPYACIHCPKLFQTASLLKQHARHHGDKNHVCQECGKAFVFNCTLLRHARIHTGVRPYTCVICSKSFIQPNNLTQHMATHSQHRIHECITCGDKFFRRDALVRHCRRKGHMC